MLNTAVNVKHQSNSKAFSSIKGDFDVDETSKIYI